MMPKAQPNRKRLFRAALAVSGMTAEKWAEKAGVSPTLLSFVVNGKRPESHELVQKIDAFIATHMAGHKALAS